MFTAEKSLLEQMQIHTAELLHRKALLGFTERDASILLLGRTFVLPEIENVVEEFYRKQLSVPEIATIIGDSETLRRLRSAQKTYIDDLFSGIYDESYVNGRLRIGQVHRRIGVEPKYYLSAVKILLDILRNIAKTRIPDPELA